MPFATRYAPQTAYVASAASSMIWTYWNQIVTSNTASAITTPTFTNTASLTNMSTLTWVAWNQNYTLTSTQLPVRADPARTEAYRAELIRIEAERATARDRAEKLLRDGLSLRQREELSAKGFFTLELLSKGQRKLYRIERGRSRNVRQVDDNGRILKTLCAHPVENVPDADTMLAQKLWLESAEEEFLRVANHS